MRVRTWGRAPGNRPSFARPDNPTDLPTSYVTIDTTRLGDRSAVTSSVSDNVISAKDTKGLYSIGLTLEDGDGEGVEGGEGERGGLQLR